MANIRHLYIFVFIIWLTASEDVSYPERWSRLQSEDTCVKLFYASVTWGMAREICRQHRADLVQIMSQQMSRLLSDLARKTHSDYVWLEYNRVYTAQRWTWSKRSKHYQEPFVKWAKGHPLTDRHCSVLSVGNATKMYSMFCKLEHFSLCQSEGNTSIPLCPSGGSWGLMQLDNWRCVREMGNVSWIDGRNTCSRLGGRQMVVDSAFALGAVRGIWKNLPKPWLGLRASEEDNIFKWLSGEQPNNWEWAVKPDTNDGKTCAYFDNGELNKDSCEMYHSFACQRQQLVTQVPGYAFMSWFTYPRLGAFLGALATVGAVLLLIKPIRGMGELDEGYDDVDYEGFGGETASRYSQMKS